MKGKELVTIGAVVVFATILSILLSNFLIPKASKNQTAEVVTAISSDFNVPSGNSVFNSEAVNPTALIQVSPNANGQPFANQ